MGKYGIVVLPFTPRQIRTQRAEVLATIRDALETARSRPSPTVTTVPAAA
jgi:hypothetical protein